MYYFSALKKYAVFKGRLGRKEFWIFWLIHTLLIIVMGLMDALTGMSDIINGNPFGAFSYIYLFGTLMPVLGATARRLHDTGKSAGWIFIVALPGIGMIWLFVLLCMKSSGQVPRPSNYQVDAQSGQSLIQCAKCSKRFAWKDAFFQRNTIGADPNTGDFRPRVFCPFCGGLVVDWDMKGDNWKWHGDNGQKNYNKPLPDDPLSIAPNLYGEAIGKINENSIDINTARLELSKAEARAENIRELREPVKNQKAGNGNAPVETPVFKEVKIQKPDQVIHTIFDSAINSIPYLSDEKIQLQYMSLSWAGKHLYTGSLQDIRPLLLEKLNEISKEAGFSYFIIKKPYANSAEDEGPIQVSCYFPDHAEPFRIWKAQDHFSACILR